MSDRAKLEARVAQALRPYENGFVAATPFPMDLAPKDGRLLRLLVDYTGDDADHPLEDETETWTIGHNNRDHTGDDRWQFAGWCWSHDHFTEGRGEVIGWLPYDASLAGYVSVGEQETPAAPPLAPRWEGQFDNFQQWVNRASIWLAGRQGSTGESRGAICIDAKGRRCNIGKDFMRARDEDAFPVRFFWDCEPEVDA